MKADLEKTKAILLEAMSTTEQQKEIRRLVVKALVLTDAELKKLEEAPRKKKGLRI